MCGKGDKGREAYLRRKHRFCALSNVVIDADQIEHLQENLIRSHCTGVGEPFPEPEVRAMMVLRANFFARGNSGVHLELVQKLVDLLNRHVHPVVPQKGSVGASGDLASENKILASPASVDSIPTSSDKEDHVSMGTTAARKVHEIIENVEHILAMEILSSTQGLYFLEPMKPGIGIQAAYRLIREVVPPITGDRRYHKDIKAIRDLIESGRILEEVEKVCGQLL